MCLCEGQPPSASVQHMALAAPRSLLICLTQCAPPTPPPLRPLHLPLGGGRAELFVFPPPSRSPPRPDSFVPFSFSPLTKSLFRLDAAENHMACDITGAGSEKRGMVEGGGVGGWRDWLARSLCSDVSRKALWEARWGGESRAGWKPYPFLSDFTPTWIIRD